MDVDRVPVVAAGLTLELDPSIGSLTQRLMAGLRTGVQQGRLPPGLALPPSRALAAGLGCSRWVVTEAYAQLVSEGYLLAVTGSATRVRELGPAATATGATAAPVPRPRLDLLPGLPDLAAFPRVRWAEAYRRAVRELPTDLLAGRSLLATGPARHTLTAYLRRTRQVQEDPTQLSLSTSSTAAVGWLARVFGGLGHHRIAVEDPSWPGLRDAARRAGLEVVGVPVDDQGLRVDLLARTDARLVIVTPAHQFPTGVAMSAERRLALIEWAEQTDGTVLEDDYDAEFRYDRRPVTSLQGMAPDRVVLMGSVSKSLSPAVQLGWVILPQWLILRLVSDDLDRGVGPSALTVAAFATMVAEGWYERHLRAVGLTYRRRRAALVAAVAHRLPGCAIGGAAAGLHLPLTLPPGTDVEQVVRAATALELPLASLDDYRLRPRGSEDGPGLVLGFGNLRSGREDEAVALLAQALAESSRREPVSGGTASRRAAPSAPGKPRSRTAR
ncbi:PLP-dependent aminotransferase family protein [uncultured Friedmanniella sp.]|uniref:MocR-like pyridoxine biosynthesis transcription factor PdxR n=1 Tax=uncultured Friedmanniella sp. TaxID=335381 RepID=UPI0035C9C86E